MRRKIAIAVAAIGLGLLPGASSAAASALDIPAIVPPQFRAAVRARLHMPRPRHRFESRFHIDIARGYRLVVIAEGNAVAIEIERPHERNRHDSLAARFDQAATAYVARGTVTPGRIAASFGRFGSVDVRFRPSGRVVESHFHRHCRGPDHLTSRLGVFVGRVRFRGERRYLAVRAHRAKGSVRTPLQLDCAGGAIESRPPTRRARAVGTQPRSTRTLLGVGWRHAVDSTELLAFSAGDLTLLLVVDERSLGRMAELRYALTLAPGEALTANEELTAATLKPPDPFDGKGLYTAAPDGSTRWSGSLSVVFPGVPRLALTGDQFKAELAAGF